MTLKSTTFTSLLTLNVAIVTKSKAPALISFIVVFLLFAKYKQLIPLEFARPADAMSSGGAPISPVLYPFSSFATRALYNLVPCGTIETVSCKTSAKISKLIYLA